MNRTFQHKISIQAIAAVVLLAACALMLFLNRTGITPLLGMVLLIIGAAAVEPHGAYRIHYDFRQQTRYIAWTNSQAYCCKH